VRAKLGQGLELTGLRLAESSAGAWIGRNEVEIHASSRGFSPSQPLQKHGLGWVEGASLPLPRGLLDDPSLPSSTMRNGVVDDLAVMPRRYFPGFL